MQPFFLWVYPVRVLCEHSIINKGGSKSYTPRGCRVLWGGVGMGRFGVKIVYVGAPFWGYSVPGARNTESKLVPALPGVLRRRPDRRSASGRDSINSLLAI